MIETPLVIYHGPGCTDGFTSGWVARRRYPNAIMKPMTYDGETLPDELVKGKDLILVDYSFNRHQMLRLAGLARSVLVLDHHKSAQSALSNLETEVTNVQVFFDLERSGASLAWEHFFPGVEAPALVEYVQDYDLWRFQLTDSQAINTAINSYKFDWDTWDKFATLGRLDSLKKEGTAIMRYQERLIDTAIGQAKYGWWQGVKVGVVNTPVKNEACNALLDRKLCQVAIAWTQNANGEYYYSLRSTKDGPDASRLAATFGGGGHHVSSSFRSQDVLSIT